MSRGCRFARWLAVFAALAGPAALAGDSGDFAAPPASQPDFNASWFDADSSLPPLPDASVELAPLPADDDSAFALLPVPEPATALFLALGSVAFAVTVIRRKNH